MKFLPRRSKRRPLRAPRPRRFTPLIGERLEERLPLALSPQLLVDLNLGTAGVTAHSPIVDVNGIAYFPGRTDAGAYQLWRSDGTAAGTFRVKDVTLATDAVILAS